MTTPPKQLEVPLEVRCMLPKPPEQSSVVLDYLPRKSGIEILPDLRDASLVVEDQDPEVKVVVRPTVILRRVALELDVCFVAEYLFPEAVVSTVPRVNAMAWKLAKGRRWKG